MVRSTGAGTRWRWTGLALALWLAGAPVAAAQQAQQGSEGSGEAGERSGQQAAPDDGDGSEEGAAGETDEAAPQQAGGEAGSGAEGQPAASGEEAASEGERAAGEESAEPSGAPGEATADEAAEAEEEAAVAPPETTEEEAEPASEPSEAEEGTDEVTEAADAEQEAPDEEGVRGAVFGEFRLRFNYLGDVPLHTIGRSGLPPELGQNWWMNQWFRLGGRLDWGGTVQVVAELDLADGMVAGQPARGVSAADRPRDGEELFPHGVVDPRKLYVQWNAPVGQLRFGLQTSHWGLGILANDGAHEQPFGDYRYGDRVFRLMFATKPLGRQSDFYVALLGDVVYRDDIGSLPDGERAMQGTAAFFYRKGEGREERSIGFYGVYRSQWRDAGDPAAPDRPLNVAEGLDVFVLDLYARWTWDEPSGGLLFAAFEGAYIFGETNLTRTADREDFLVRQLIFAAQVGRLSDELDVVLEGGYTSGDSNAEDGYQRRGSMDPDHRVGLILFPELLAAQTARAATLARSPELFARPQPGTDMLPTDGSVAGAWYLFPYAKWRPLSWLDARLGAVWARATTPVVDSFRQRAESRSVNFRGGDPQARDLGLEIDGALLGHFKLGGGVVASGGLEGGVLFPGHAFDDEAGNGLGPLGMVRLRAGVRF